MTCGNLKDINRISDIWTTPHPANQSIIELARDRMSGNGNEVEFLYKNHKRVGSDATFKLVQSSNGSNEIPLMVAAQFAVDRPGEYCMVIKGHDRFQLTCYKFTLDKGVHSKVIGPFYAVVHVECPFRAEIDVWSIFHCDGTLVEDFDIDLTMYFFLGSTALPLREYPHQDIHVWELIKLTIPYYEEIAEKNFAEVERSIVGRVVSSLWQLSDRDFHYDSRRGVSSFLAGQEFQLGRMLMKQETTCNCYDLAALAYAAFKSFGKKRIGGPNGPETDVSVVCLL
jgi:hypothetical protein